MNKDIVKTCVNGHSKIDKIKILMTNGSWMKVESIAQCTLRPALSDNWSWKSICGLFKSGHFTVLLNPFLMARWMKLWQNFKMMPVLKPLWKQSTHKTWLHLPQNLYLNHPWSITINLLPLKCLCSTTTNKSLIKRTKVCWWISLCRCSVAFQM